VAADVGQWDRFEASVKTRKAITTLTKM